MKRLYTRLVRWLIFPVVVAVALVVALTSGGGTRRVSSAAVTQAADITTRVAGADMHVTIAETVLGHSITLVGGGHESFATRNGVFNLAARGLPGPVGGQATFQMRFLYPRLFMRSRLFSSALPPGKSWLELNLARALQRQGVSTSVLSSAGSDPAQFLDYLKAASGGVENLGTAQIRGVPTTHYHAVLDVRRYPSLLPRSRRAAARKGIARLVQLTGNSHVPTDVWVDSRHLVRQERVTLSIHPRSLPSGLHEVVTVDLFHFGPKPRVTAPPADQTYDLTSHLPTPA
jgi:hypothetical protein